MTHVKKGAALSRTPGALGPIRRGDNDQHPGAKKGPSFWCFGNVIYWSFYGIYGGFMGFYGGLMEFYGGLMVFYGGLMGFYGPFYGGLMGFNMI